MLHIYRVQAELGQAELGYVLCILQVHAEVDQAEAGNVLHVRVQADVFNVLFTILLQAEVNFCIVSLF